MQKSRFSVGFFVFLFSVFLFVFIRQDTFAMVFPTCPSGFTFVNVRVVNDEVRVTCSATIKTCFYAKKQIGFRYKQGTKRSSCTPFKKNVFALSEESIKKLRQFQKGVKVTFTRVQKISTNNDVVFIPQKKEQNDSSFFQEQECTNREQLNMTTIITGTEQSNISSDSILTSQISGSLQTENFSPTENLSPFASSFVRAHNLVRVAVGVPELRWSDAVAQSAQAWANKLQSQGCLMKHSSRSERNNYGENLYWFSNSYGALPTPEDVVAARASEKDWYDYQTNTCNPPISNGGCGHYTQIVWKDTREVGCGYAVCKEEKGGYTMTTSIWVCHYNPVGNWIGQKPY